MPEQSLLIVDDLAISFRSGDEVVKAVRHISFEVRVGKTLAVVGESGSGKSVSSLSLMSLLQHGKVIYESGTFFLSGPLLKGEEGVVMKIKPGDDFLKTLRGKEISMIFQEPMTSLNPVMTCGEQVSEMIRKHEGISRENARLKTIELFEEVLLPVPVEVFNRYPYQLSGGQRQRVMIAMAISCSPKILIADEPTTALDVTVQKEILRLIKHIQEKRKMSVIFITHDLGVVAEIADDILVMNKGEVVEAGNALDILHSPKHPYTRGLLACKPDPGKKSQRLLTVEDVLRGDSENKKTSASDLKRKLVDDSILLEVKNISKVYPGQRSGILGKKSLPFRAVNNVSFHIRRGETLGLVGESGCGKTTLSRMLLGLIPSTEGEILYAGKDITKISKRELNLLRKDIQIIFQDPYSSLNPKHTIGNSIMEPMTVFGLHGSAQQRKLKTLELLQQVGLRDEHFSRYPHEFSGGQRQRIVIARALACEPSFIICDESVSALDVSVQAQVLNLLNDLQRDFGLTYLFISHDLNVVYYMSDRIMVMNKGIIEEMGSCDAVFFHPQQDYTKRLLSSIPGRH